MILITALSPVYLHCILVALYPSIYFHSFSHCGAGDTKFHPPVYLINDLTWYLARISMESTGSYFFSAICRGDICGFEWFVDNNWMDCQNKMVQIYTVTLPTGWILMDFVSFLPTFSQVTSHSACFCLSSFKANGIPICLRSEPPQPVRQQWNPSDKIKEGRL